MSNENVRAMIATMTNKARSKQVSVRLTRDEYGRFTAAAKKNHAKPAKLARILILAGLQEIE